MATRTPLQQYYKDNPELEGEEAHADVESKRFYTDGALGRLQSPTAISGIDASQYPNVREVSTQMAGGAANVSDASGAYAKSQTRDQYVQDALTRMQAGLGGITAPENQALLEQGQQQLRQDEASTLRRMRGEQGAMGMTGSSAAAQRNRLYAQTNQQKQQMTSNLIAQNVAEKGRRLTEYGGAAQASATQMASAQDAALARLLGARENVAAYQQKGEQLNQLADQSNFENRYKVANTNLELGKYNQAYAQETNKYNIGQGEKELAGRIGSYYGDIGTSEARRTTKAAEKLGREGLRVAKGGVKGKKKTSKKK